jgi:hypothetical protein
MKRIKIWLAVFSLMFLLSACRDDAEQGGKTEKIIEEAKPQKFKVRVNENTEIIETSTDRTLTVAEAHAEADRKIEQLKQLGSIIRSSSPNSATSVVQKVNLNSDEYPEIIYLKEMGDRSQLQFIRYVVDSEYYPENQWVIFYSEIFENPYGIEPLVYFGNIRFSPNGTDYPVFGNIKGNNKFLGYGIFGIGEKENAELVVDRMSKSYPQGKLILDNSKEYKLTVTSYGNIVETISEKDIK